MHYIFERSNFCYVRDTHVFTIHSFFHHQKTRDQIRDDGGYEQQDRRWADIARTSRPRWPLKSIPTIQIKFRSCSRWRRELSAAVISCGRRTIKQLRASNIINTIYPARLDSRSNPRLVGVFSLPFPSNARALYRGFTVAWSQSHENWVAPRAYRRTRLCNRSTLWSTLSIRRFSDLSRSIVHRKNCRSVLSPLR